MHHTTGMTERQPATHLEQIRLDQHWIQQSIVRLQRLLQIPIQKFKDEIQLPILLHAVLQIDNVLVGQFPQERDLAEGRGGDALVFYLEADAFEGDDFVGLSVACLVDYSVGSFA